MLTLFDVCWVLIELIFSLEAARRGICSIGVLLVFVI